MRADDHAPWHPGRCAALSVNGVLVGHAGELHPRVVEALGLPARTAAAEIDLDGIIAAGDTSSFPPRLSTYPLAISDVALVVPADVPAADVEHALRAGAGQLLESVRLFDVYAGARGRRRLPVPRVPVVTAVRRPHVDGGGDERGARRRRRRGRCAGSVPSFGRELGGIGRSSTLLAAAHNHAAY